MSSPPTPATSTVAVTPRRSGTTQLGAEDDDGDGDDGVKREEIVPSYDFQPIHPIAVSSSPALSFDGGSARAWGSLYPMANANAAPVRNYSSLDSFEPAKIIAEKDQHALMHQWCLRLIEQ